MIVGQPLVLLTAMRPPMQTHNETVGMQLVGKTIKSIDEVHDTYLVVSFTDGTLANFKPKQNNQHNSKWSAVAIDYHDDRDAIW
jgi:hypothetical protein